MRLFFRERPLGFQSLLGPQAQTVGEAWAFASALGQPLPGVEGEGVLSPVLWFRIQLTPGHAVHSRVWGRLWLGACLEWHPSWPLPSLACSSLSLTDSPESTSLINHFHKKPHLGVCF